MKSHFPQKLVKTLVLTICVYLFLLIRETQIHYTELRKSLEHKQRSEGSSMNDEAIFWRIDWSTCSDFIPVDL